MSFFQSKKRKTDTTADDYEVNPNVSLINLTDNEENINSTERCIPSASQSKDTPTTITTENKTNLKSHLFYCTSDSNACYIPEKPSD